MTIIVDPSFWWCEAVMTKEPFVIAQEVITDAPPDPPPTSIRREAAREDEDERASELP